jgi:hypothetical protein
MASFNVSGHDLAAATASNTTTTDDDRNLTIIYGTLGTLLALMSLMVAVLSFLRRPCRRRQQQRRGTDQRDGPCEDCEDDELRCNSTVVQDDDCVELQNHYSASN